MYQQCRELHIGDDWGKSFDSIDLEEDKILYPNISTMTKERILELIDKLFKIYEELEEKESDLPENNLVEFVWEDENGNGIYKIK